MASWYLECANCQQSFRHSQIAGTLKNMFFPEKPIFPEGGAELECPHCGHKATYQRHQLSYRA
jgi:DNA-directed RNA polymerase subunit RPC12/RpoP